MDLDIAEGIQGLDDEIALLRVKIKSLVEHDPDNLRLLMDGTNTLARLIKTRYGLNDRHANSVKDAITTVLSDLGTQFGLGIIKDAL